MKGQRDYVQGEVLQLVEVVDYTTPDNPDGRQIRYNLMKAEATEGRAASVEYDYYNISTLTKKQVKVGYIRQYYDIDDEQSIQNDKETKPEKWAEYQQIRADADARCTQLGLV